MQPEVVCLGAVNLDLLYRVEDLTPFREVWPLLRPGGELALAAEEEAQLAALLARYGEPGGRSGGGQAANTAFALAKMGISAALVGRVGEDEDGDFLRAEMAGVDLSHLRRAGRSGRAYVLVDSAGERTIFVAPHTNDELREEDVPLEVLAGASYVHFTSFVGPGPLKVQTSLTARLKAGGGEGRPFLTLDPGELYARRGREALAGLLAAADILLVTEAEWQALGGEPHRRPEWAPPLILLKRGAHGARAILAGGWQDFPAPQTAAVDTLGAGDVFAAGFLAGRLRGLPLAKAVMLAVRAASASVAGRGREAYPDAAFLREQVERLGGGE